MPAVLVPISASPASTMTREFSENYQHKIERYNSLPTLDNDDRQSTLIKIKVVGGRRVCALAYLY